MLEDAEGEYVKFAEVQRELLKIRRELQSLQELVSVARQVTAHVAMALDRKT
jgi:hypothetical protein